MIDPTEKRLSVSRQCRMLGICRSSRYYKRRQWIQSDDLKLMRLIDEQYLKNPSWGSRSTRNYLRRQGYKVNRKRVQHLMRIMGIEAIYPKPKTSRPHPDHKVYPYPGSFPTPLKPIFASGHWKTPFCGMAALRFSIPTKGLSSPARPLQAS